MVSPYAELTVYNPRHLSRWETWKRLKSVEGLESTCWDAHYILVEVLCDIQRKNLGIQLSVEAGTGEGSSCQCEGHEHTDANGSHGCG